MSIPVACSLSEPERRERRQTVIAELRHHIRQVTERADGYALDLAPSDEAIVAATTSFGSSAGAVPSCGSR